MWMLQEIFHAVFESTKSRFCWGNCASTEMHGKILKIIANLKSGVYDAINPVIEVSSM